MLGAEANITETYYPTFEQTYSTFTVSVNLRRQVRSCPIVSLPCSCVLLGVLLLPSFLRYPLPAGCSNESPLLLILCAGFLNFPTPAAL